MQPDVGGAAACQQQPLRLPRTASQPLSAHGRRRRMPKRKEMFMIEGTLIAESLRTGTSLENMKLTVRTISRFQAQGTTGDQPGIWTTLGFEADEAQAEDLAQTFAGALDQPGWYVDFRSPTETFVVFPDQTFRYPRGDDTGRTKAQAHGRQLAIPQAQLDRSE